MRQMLASISSRLGMLPSMPAQWHCSFRLQLPASQAWMIMAAVSLSTKGQPSFQLDALQDIRCWAGALDNSMLPGVPAYRADPAI